jgi:hypothetical protein
MSRYSSRPYWGEYSCCRAIEMQSLERAQDHIDRLCTFLDKIARHKHLYITRQQARCFAEACGGMMPPVRHGCRSLSFRHFALCTSSLNLRTSHIFGAATSCVPGELVAHAKASRAAHSPDAKSRGEQSPAQNGRAAGQAVHSATNERCSVRRTKAQLARSLRDTQR